MNRSEFNGSLETTLSDLETSLTVNDKWAMATTRELIAQIDESYIKKITDQFNYKRWQITTKGTEDAPIWCFNCETEDKIFRNSLDKEQLGTVKILKKPCSIEAVFLAHRRDIEITYAESFFLSKNITNNKKSIIKLIIEKQLLNVLKPYLSADKIIYE